MARNYIRWLIRPVAHCKEGCLISPGYDVKLPVIKSKDQN